MPENLLRENIICASQINNTSKDIHKVHHRDTSNENYAGWSQIKSFIYEESKEVTCEIEFDTSTANDAFISGYKIDGRDMFPVTGFLVLIWNIYAKMHNKDMMRTPIIFEDIVFKDLTYPLNDGRIKFTVKVNCVKGTFTVQQYGNLIVTGKIYILQSNHKIAINIPQIHKSDSIALISDDIYRELQMRGYQYSGIFRSISSVNPLLRSGNIVWKNNWVSFLDAMLQFNIIEHLSRNLYLPCKIQRLSIQPTLHYASIDNDTIRVIYNRGTRTIISSGVEIRNVEWMLKEKSVVMLEEYIKYQEVAHAHLIINRIKDLSSLSWIESPLKYVQDSELNRLCRVNFAALNNFDLILVNEKLSSAEKTHTRSIGIEFSGKKLNGKRVMGIVSSRGLSTTVLADKHLLWEVPDHWSLKAAATVPVAYAAAYYALFVKGNLKRGDSVLIHLGSSDIGQASINLVLQTGCTIYATDETKQRRNFIRDRYLEIKTANISSSCDDSFEQMVLQRTDGRGVDLVMNLLNSKDLLTPTLRCLAEGGRFLQLAYLDEETVWPPFVNKTYHSIQINSLPDSEKSILAEYVKEGIAYGTVVPLHTAVYTVHQLREAFKCLVKRIESEKVLIKIVSEEVPISEMKTMKTLALTQTYLNPNKTYVIIGDLNELLLELIDWMVSRGASKVMLNVEQSALTTYQSWFVDRWQQGGVIVKTSYVDCTRLSGAKALLQQAGSMGAIGGIIISCLASLPSTNQNCLETLDEASRQVCPDLDIFMLLSCEISSEVNSIMNRRKANGFHGIAVTTKDTICKPSSEEKQAQTFSPRDILNILNKVDKVLWQEIGNHV